MTKFLIYLSLNIGRCVGVDLDSNLNRVQRHGGQIMEIDVSKKAIQATYRVLECHGLKTERADTLYSSKNLVLSLFPLPIVAKISEFSENNDKALELSIAQHLQENRIPCVVPTSVLPVKVYAQDGFQITFWDYFEHDSKAQPNRDEALKMLDLLHNGLKSFRGPLPDHDSRLDCYLEALNQDSAVMEGLSNEDLEFLKRVLQQLKSQLNSPLTSRGIIHGDCGPHNIIIDGKGHARWIDFESTCFGPLAWDYISYFGPKDPCLAVYSGTVKLLAEIGNMCLAMRCWMKKKRTLTVQKVADDHLKKLKLKYSFLL